MGTPTGHKIRHGKKRAFLAAIAETGNITRSAEIAQIDRTLHYKWLERDPQYGAAFEAAKEEAADRMEEEARRRAVEGYDEPVFYRGEPMGVIRRYSDTLLIFMLKGARPEKYRDQARVEHTGAGGDPLRIVLTWPEQRDADA